jgi:PAS domain S-box-containing protein
LFLQLFLFVVSIPVLSIATVIEEKSTVERNLRESEQRLRLAQRAARIGSFDVNMRTGVDVWQPETEALYGLPPGGFGGTLAAFENLIHPEDRERVIGLTQEMIRTGQDTDAEWRVVWPDGSVHWIAGRGRVLRDESGEPLRIIGVNMDVTERKLAEDALNNVGRRLIEAHEEERTWIARELHDDICQRIALLSVELEKGDLLAPDTVTGIHDHSGHLRQRLFDLGKDVQNLAHRLHSSKLEYLGLLAAAKSFCRELSEQRNVRIEFKHSNIPSGIPKEVSLCLFRVLQEATQNALKHSGTQDFSVELHGTQDGIRLTVSDSGIGFDLHDEMKHRGLGLISMRERLRLVNGDLSIQSEPGRGTTILARVPLGYQNHSVAIAG